MRYRTVRGCAEPIQPSALVLLYTKPVAMVLGDTLGATCQHQMPPLSSYASTTRSHLCPGRSSPSVTLTHLSQASKHACSSILYRSRCTRTHKPFSSKASKRHAVCWAGSGDQSAIPADAAVPSPSAKPKPLFSPLVPVFRRTKHDNDIRGLAVPALFSLLLDPIMSLVDCAIIGRLGSDSLAATGASISIFSLAGLLVSFLSYVTVPAVAEAATSGDDAEVSRVISTGWLPLPQHGCLSLHSPYAHLAVHHPTL